MYGYWPVKAVTIVMGENCDVLVVVLHVSVEVWLSDGLSMRSIVSL